MKKIKIVLMILLFTLLVMGIFSNTSLIVRITFAIFVTVILKITIFYLITKLRCSKKQQVKVEDIISHKYKPNNFPKIQKPIQRDEVIEKKYTEVKSIFTSKMKNKQMNRDEILALRNYLTLYLHEYEHKKSYQNDCHAIYSMLKAKDLSLSHLNEIEDFLNSVGQ